MIRIDLPSLQSITLGDCALRGIYNDDSCSLTMRSTNEMIRCSLTMRSTNEMIRND